MGQRESVVVMKLLQDRTKHGMFGHPTGNTFVLVSSMSRFLDDEAYCSMVTRNGFLPEGLNNMRRASEKHVFSAIGKMIKIRPILDRVRMTPKAVASLLA